MTKRKPYILFQLNPSGPGAANPRAPFCLGYGYNDSVVFRRPDIHNRNLVRSQWSVNVQARSEYWCYYTPLAGRLIPVAYEAAKSVETLCDLT